MKFSAEVTINKDREEVWRLFDNVENLYKWQLTLKEFKLESGGAGKPGAKSRLKYLEGKREVEMIETIISRNEPEEFSGTYEMKGAKHWIKNSFEVIDENKTKWVMDSEFQFSGIYKLMTPFIKGMIIKRTNSDMNRFKNFAEGKLD